MGSGSIVRGDTAEKIWAVACAGTAAIVYYALWPLVTYDVPNWLLPWYSHIIEAGRVEVFSRPFGNYTPPYLYLLSGFSLLNTWLAPVAVLKLMAAIQNIVLAASIYFLLRAAQGSQPLAGAATVLVLPTVVLNGPVMSQCDAIWISACVMAVAQATKQHPIRMLLWFGVAGAFKLQAAFLAPFAIAMMLRFKTPYYWAGLPALLYILFMLPAAVAGWPLMDLTTIYFHQADWARDFINNAANPWTLGNFAPHGVKYLFPAGYAFALVATGAVVALTPKTLSPATILRAGLLSAIAIPFVLPRMHERYFLLADVFAFVLAWTMRDRTSIIIAILVMGSSTLALSGYLLRESVLILASIAPMACALALATTVYLKRENGFEAETTASP
jgi:Gpi18-like mannosyltransferase